MGKKRGVVKQLLDGLWDMDDNEFEEKFNTLSYNDKIKVSNAIDKMDPVNHVMGDDYDDERISAYEAALIWQSNGKDEDYMFGYTEEELEDAL